MTEYLKNPDLAKELKNFNSDQLKELSFELREKIINSVDNCGGHLASSLGAVEIIVALHFVFDFPKDKLIFDVGHQAYAHKLLTGRADGFERKLRKLDGIGAFLKRSESEYDTFTTGHAGNSVSLALGLSRARDLRGENYEVVSVVGDASVVNGMSFEAFNDYVTRPTKHIVVLNDNNMSISKAVGAVSRKLNELRRNPVYKTLKRAVVKTTPKNRWRYRVLRRIKNGVKYVFSTGIIFEEFGYECIGPVDGHNIDALRDALFVAKKSSKSTLIHVVTKKGKGHKDAEENPELFHGVESKYSEKRNILSYSKEFGAKLSEIANIDKDIVVVCPAMIAGSGLNDFSKKFRERCFDVGIAEEHAVTMAAGLARGGMKPYVAIYSTFLQRAVDQVIHDLALQNLPVRLCVDRAGFVGSDGETHQGIFDLLCLTSIPGMTVISPASIDEFDQMLDFSRNYDKPLAIRYSRGGVSNEEFSSFTFGKWSSFGEGEICLIASGAPIVKECLICKKRLDDLGVKTMVVNASTIKPLDWEKLTKIKDKKIFVVEDNLCRGGLASFILEYYAQEGYKVCLVPICVRDEFVKQGRVDELYQLYGLSSSEIVKKVLNFINFY